jgi:hypothetical protein
MTPQEEMDREQTLVILARELCKGCANKDKPWNDPDCIGCTPEHPRRVEYKINRRAALVGLILLAAILTAAACLTWAKLANEQTGKSDLKTIMIGRSAAYNRDIGYELAVGAQYLSDGTTCIIGTQWSAVWIDREGGRHEVPTEWLVVK